MESVADHFALQKKMDNKKMELYDIERQLIEKINIEREGILKGIDEVKISIEFVIGLKAFEDYK